MFTPWRNGTFLPIATPIKHLSSPTAKHRTQTDLNSNRYGASSLHQRDSRSALFEGYNGGEQAPRAQSQSPNPYGYAGGYAPNGGYGVERHAYRSATPNKKGQYSNAVLNELESQNDEQVAGILGKVRVLKDVCAILETTKKRGGAR